jgi:nitrite reductase (NO-forming)
MNHKKTLQTGFKIIVFICTVSFASCTGEVPPINENEIDATLIQIDGELNAELSTAPNVPRPVGDRSAKKLIVDMEIIEEVGEMIDGVKYVYWTFGGSVPGSFIRARIGDEIEFTLKNHPNNKLPHNIDLHAVTGAGGGASSSLVAPGHEVTFSFKALNPGLYVYHCATAPVGMHIANGMYGLILIEPAGGLPKVDKEYYIMQGDFYTKGAYGQPGLQPFDMGKAIKEDADYVVFNGKVGSLTGDNALTANVGNTIRLFVGNGGPNLVSSFHVIGEIFDKVHVEGGSLINENVQTTLIPSGGAAIIEFKVNVPGSFVIVDHSIFRAFNKGALGILKVEGKERKNIYSGKQIEGVYNPEGSAVQSMPGDVSAIVKASNTADRIKLGENIYKQSCFACHQNKGQGIPGAFPPLAKSDYLNDDVNRAIDIILKGKSGEITVNGKKYNSLMTAQALSNEEVANVLTYVYSKWGNNKTVVTPAMVAKAKK